MLKEIFLIGEGVLFFHYSPDPKVIDSDESILSSGLLAAIKDFSAGARADALDSFSMEHEYFLFKDYGELHKTLVGVYERDTPQTLARRVLDKIHEVIIEAHLPDEGGMINLASPEKITLKETIAHLVEQTFGSEADAAHLDELLRERTDIQLAFIVNRSTKSLIAKFARPKPLFREQHVRDLFLLISTLEKALTRLNLNGYCTMAIIKSNEYTVAIICSGNKINVATGVLNSPEAAVTEMILQMSHYPSMKSVTGPLDEFSTEDRFHLDDNGRMEHLIGRKFSPPVSLAILTLINNINGLYKLLTRRNFNEFKAFIINDKTHELNITREIAKKFLVRLRST